MNAFACKHLVSQICRDLNHNSLSGTIPESFSLLTKLSTLFEVSYAGFSQRFRNLASNTLSGTIPESFSSLTRLTTLHEFTSVTAHNIQGSRL